MKKCFFILFIIITACTSQPVPTSTNTPNPLTEVAPDIIVTPNYLQSDSDTLEVEFGQLFALRWDQTAYIPSENITVLHTTDIEFECPADAACEVPLLATDFFEVIVGDESLGVQKWASEMVFGDYVLTTAKHYEGYEYREHEFEIILAVERQEDILTAQQLVLDISSDCDSPTEQDVWQYKARASSETEVHMLGIREPGEGQVDVHVKRADVPMILILSAYESTEWQLHLDQEVELEIVVLNGYEAHTVGGAENVPLTDHSGVDKNIFEYVYIWETSELGIKHGLAPNWVYKVESIAGAPLTSFTGCYEASEFTIQ